MRTGKKVLKFKKFKVAKLNMYLLQGGGETDTNDLTFICPTREIETCMRGTCTVTTGAPASDVDNPCSDRCFGDGLGE